MVTPDRWIFVTGAPRSGTTFAGKILSTPVSVDYIHEPFNPACGLPGLDTRYVYVRPGTEEERGLRRSVGRMLAYDFRLTTAFYERDSELKRMAKRAVGSRGPYYLRLARINPLSRFAVVKDPVGCLLTGWLTDVFGFRSVVLLRHPVAFVASTRRLGWNLREHLDALTRQPHLVEDWLGSGLRELAERSWSTHAEEGAILWRALNTVLLAQAGGNPNIVVLRHEDLSARPVSEFRSLYDLLGLPWSRRVERRIRRLTEVSNRAEAGRGRVQDFARDSAALLELRLGQIDAAERERIWELTRYVAAPYYPRQTFMLEDAESRA